MIIGIGTDLVHMDRIEKLYARFGDQFLMKYFTDHEITHARQKGGLQKNFISILAKRFAAKEAFAKAIGTGIGQHVFMKEVGVENDAKGRPCLVLTGRTLETLEKTMPDGYKGKIHLSLTDEPPLAKAFVIIEGLKE